MHHTAHPRPSSVDSATTSGEAHGAASASVTKSLSSLAILDSHATNTPNAPGPPSFPMPHPIFSGRFPHILLSIMHHAPCRSAYPPRAPPG